MVSPTYLHLGVPAPLGGGTCVLVVCWNVLPWTSPVVRWAGVCADIVMFAYVPVPAGVAATLPRLWDLS